MLNNKGYSYFTGNENSIGLTGIFNKKEDMQNEFIYAYRCATIEEKRSAFKKLINNQKKHDKSSIGYMIGVINQDSPMRYWPEDYARKDIVSKLEELVEIDANLLKVTRSDWQMCQIGKFILESKKQKNEKRRTHKIRP